MRLDPPTLLFAASAALALASAAAASIGIRQRLRRGVWWWIGANSALVAALVGHAMAEADTVLLALTAALALQWPVVTLAGLRRFFARGSAGMPAWADWLVLGIASAAAAGAWFVPFNAVTPQQVFAGAMLVVTLYAAVVVPRLEDFETAPVLRSLLFGLAGSALLQVTWIGLALSGFVAVLAAPDFALAALLAPAVTALLMPQLSLVMNHERNMAQLRASHRKLRHMVEVDTLTQLPNRRHFHELAAKAIQPAPGLASLLVFDVDRLKHINDMLGHSVGDEALRQIGTALRETLRRRDVAGRLGGDEFAVVLPRTPVADIEVVVARINARIDDRQVAPRIARVKLNVGATQMLANETIADALRRAEIALEAARDEARRQAAAMISAFGSVTNTPMPPEVVAAAAPSLGFVPISLKPTPLPVGEVTQDAWTG
ncbi:MAG: GGDEF domain-containing protein [Pseudomonadota bacterium]|nr:GGDEF domain-containing protein [Pseudomonadota bacterium]